jgi:hypothetical protein
MTYVPADGTKASVRPGLSGGNYLSGVDGSSGRRGASRRAAPGPAGFRSALLPPRPGGYGWSLGCQPREGDGDEEQACRAVSVRCRGGPWGSGTGIEVFSCAQQSRG